MIPSLSDAAPVPSQPVIGREDEQTALPADLLVSAISISTLGMPHRHEEKWGRRTRSCHLLPCSDQPVDSGRWRPAAPPGRRRSRDHHPGFGGVRCPGGSRAATSAPLGFVRTTEPTRTVGTVSSPRFALRTKARACSSDQMFRHSASIPRRRRSRRSPRQNGHPGRQKISGDIGASCCASVMTTKPPEATRSFLRLHFTHAWANLFSVD